jgi:hypothetical protein
MDLRPDLYSELYREMVREQTAESRRLGERRRQARLSAVNLALRARVARMLFRAATAVDSGEVWRVLWEQLTRSDVVKSNGG